MKKFLTFKTAEEQYAFGIEHIITIDKVEYEPNSTQDSRIKKVPSYPEYVEGVYSYKGTIMPIINFNLFINGTHMVRHDENKIIFIRGSVLSYGILVNDVQSIIELDDEHFSQIYQKVPVYTVEKENDIYIVPDIDKMLESPQVAKWFREWNRE